MDRPQAADFSKWIDHRPPIYGDTYKKMTARGEFVEVSSGGKREKSIRIATSEEREAYEARHMEAAKRAGVSVWDGGDKRPYAERDEAGKKQAIDNYFAGFSIDNKLPNGERNKQLNRLAFNMQQGGLWDSYAQERFYELASGCGLPDSEVRGLMRPRDNALASA